MKKAIFLDIDGTLIDSFSGIREIREEVKKEIRKLQSEGNYVFIATGRPYAFLNEEILNFGFDGFILANGATVIFQGKVLYSDFMDKEFVENLVNECEENNMEYILEAPHYSYLKDDFKEFHKYYESAGISKKLFLSTYDLNGIDVQKIEVLCSTDEERARCISLVNSNEAYGYFNSISKDACEIYLKRNTKAHAILKVLYLLDIKIENSYAFGDGSNDIEMLSTVGCGIAMGNASDEVKKYANKVTDTVHNDGVALGIRKYISC